MTNQRPFKGNNLLTLLDDYTVVDIETSSNGRLYGEIIEIGAVKVRNNEVVSTFNELIKPTKPIDAWTQSIHHISNEMVKDKPPMSIVYRQFIEFLGDDLIIGHNVNFDINYLYDYHHELNMPPLSNDYLDTLRLARRTLKGHKSYSLSNLSQHFGFNATIHRAVEDCLATHNLYQILKNRLSEKEKLFLSTLKTTHYSNKSFDLESLKAESTLLNNNSYFNEKAVVFTGKLTQFTRKQAAQLVVNLGGKVYNEFNPEVDILVVGDVNLQVQKYGKLSSKHQQALFFQQQGYPIDILTQEEFIEKLNQFD